MRIKNKVKRKYNRLYRSVYTGIKQRCLNPKCKDYPKYGGRGIKICQEWLDDFDNFYAWAYANGYDETAPKGQCTLDRINVNGNYCPENCRWISIREQNSNKNNNHSVTYCGETHTIAEWARITGMSESALYNRANRNWDLDQMFSQNVRGRRV